MKAQGALPDLLELHHLGQLFQRGGEGPKNSA